VNSPGGTLIVGVDSALGNALWRRLMEQGTRVFATTRRRPERDLLLLDLTADAERFSIPRGVNRAYLCAAVTGLAECRRSPEATAAVNVRATVTLARRLIAAGVFVVFPSTNLVFDGSQPRCPSDAPPAPREEYGRQKMQAEEDILAAGAAAAVVRLSKVIHPALPLFVQWRDALKERQTVRPLSDMTLSPVPIAAVVDLLLIIGEGRHAGIFQFSADRDVGYVEAAHRLAWWLGAESSLVHPWRVAEAGLRGPPPPRFTSLDVGRVVRELGMAAPDAMAALDDTFAALAGKTPR